MVDLSSKMSKQETVLLTGGSGMVGRNIQEHTRFADKNIVAPTRSELDLLNPEACVEYLVGLKPDIVVHAAGLVGGIQANINEPVRFLVSNMDIGRNLVLAAREANVKTLLNLGSSCMYPRDAQNPLAEELILTGRLEPTNEGYALAKIVTQRLCEYISREDSYFQYKTIVPCNLFGKFDTFDPKSSHLLPSIIHKIHSALKSGCAQIDIWGDGEARREFMYAGDLADAIGYILNTFDKVPDVMNIGIGHDYSVNEYYRHAAEVIGYTGDFVHDLARPVGMKQKLVSTTEQNKLGWYPKVSLQDGIKATYEHYIEVQNQ